MNYFMMGGPLFMSILTLILILLIGAAIFEKRGERNWIVGAGLRVLRTINRSHGCF